MKTFRSKRGPFAERPYLEESEIERTCMTELIALDLLPKEPRPVRIDRYVEKRFGVTIQYDDLGSGVLGYTQFGKSGVKAVVVSRALDEEGTVVANRRVRSTLAHEAGHGIFHAHLFIETGANSLFPEGIGEKPRVLCRDEEQGGTGGYKGNWWEWQANRAIGGLLLPKGLVAKAVEQFVEPVGLLGLTVLPTSHRELAVQHVAEVFDVNQVVARRRLEEMFCQGADGQPCL
jgi:hypothetical protein